MDEEVEGQAGAPGHTGFGDSTADIPRSVGRGQPDGRFSKAGLGAAGADRVGGLDCRVGRYFGRGVSAGGVPTSRWHRCPTAQMPFNEVIALACLARAQWTSFRCHHEKVGRAVRKIVAHGVAIEEKPPSINGIGRTCRIHGAGPTRFQRLRREHGGRAMGRDVSPSPQRPLRDTPVDRITSADMSASHCRIARTTPT